MAAKLLPYISLDLYHAARARRDRDRLHRIRHAESLGIPRSQIAVWQIEHEDEQLRTAHYRARIGVPAQPGPRVLTPNCWQIGEPDDPS